MALGRDEYIERSFEERFRKRKLVGYFYYDTPDGQDLHLKLMFATKCGTILGIITGITNAYSMYPFAKNYKERNFRFAKGFFPVVAAANVYTFLTYMSTNLRKKDDQYNHLLGGLAAGTVIGAGFRNAGIGLVYSLCLGIIGALQKIGVMRGVTIIPEDKGEYYSPYLLRKFDTTLFKDDIRGNWTREPAK